MFRYSTKNEVQTGALRHVDGFPALGLLRLLRPHAATSDAGCPIRICERRHEFPGTLFYTMMGVGRRPDTHPTSLAGRHGETPIKSRTFPIFDRHNREAVGTERLHTGEKPFTMRDT